MATKGVSGRLWVERDSGLPVLGTRLFDGVGHGFLDHTDLPAPTITTRPPAVTHRRNTHHGT